MGVYVTQLQNYTMPQPKKPTKILELSGAYKRNPQRRREAEPQPDKPIGRCPKYLDKEHKVIWDEIVKNCAEGVLTCQDRHTLELIVRGMHHIRHGDATGAEIDRVFKQLGKFGMTPSERSNVIVPKQETKKNEFGGL